MARKFISPVPLALGWAAAIIGIAVLGRSDLIPASTAETLVMVMPALAVGTIGAFATRPRCASRA